MRAARLSLLLLPAIAFPQARPASVFVSTPQPRVIAGDSLTLTAVARDATGAIVPNVTFAWSSGTPALADVDAAGRVTAKSLGVVDIIATTSGIRGSVRLQILPAKIEITPTDRTLFIGQQQQYSARVLDSNGGVIPNVPLTWGVVGADGFQINAATIDRNGMLYAGGVGRMVVRAYFSYNSGPGQFVPQYFGTTRLAILPPQSFRLTKLASTADARDSFVLRPRRSSLNANDAGQIAYVGSMEGYASSLLLWDHGSFQSLISSGLPSFLAGTMLYDFDDPSINNNGQVLTIARSYGLGGSLILAGPAGYRFLLLDGTSDGGVEAISGITITRFALNDSGTAAFRASFRNIGGRITYTGVFHVTADGLVQLDASSQYPVPGFTTNMGFDADFGIDNNNALNFIVNENGARALMRLDDSGVRRILGTGDDLPGGLKVRTVGQVVTSPAGHFAVYAVSQTNVQFVVLFKAGEIDKPRFLSLVSYSNLYGISTAGEVLLYGDAGAGGGLYAWNGGTSARTVFQTNHPSPNGEVFTRFDSGAISSNGDVIAQGRTPNQLLLAAHATAAGKKTTLFQPGLRINAPGNPTFYLFSNGARKGPAYLITGGNRQSVMEVTNSGLRPKTLLGDRLPNASFYEGVYSLRRNSEGDLFVTTDQSLHRVSDTDAQLLARFPMRVDEGILSAPGTLALNANGVVAMNNGTNFGVQRISTLDDGQALHPIAYLGSGNPAYRTNSPGGGYFEGLNDMVADENGRVLANLRVTNGPSGLFLWDGANWNTALLLNTTKILNRPVTGVNLIRAGDTFYAYVTLDPGIPAIVKYVDGDWKAVLSRGDPMPSGNAIDGVSTFDVNRKGQAVIRTNGGGVSALVFVNGDNLLTVHVLTDPTPAGEFLKNYEQVDLRDDGKIYFTSLNTSDEFVVYVAEPLF